MEESLGYIVRKAGKGQCFVWRNGVYISKGILFENLIEHLLCYSERPYQGTAATERRHTTGPMHSKAQQTRLMHSGVNSYVQGDERDVA